MKQVLVGGRYVPWSLTASVLCWLIPGAWSGLGTLVPSLFIPAEVRDSGWFGSATVAVLAVYTVVVLAIPVLMLYRNRVARALLSLVAAWYTVGAVAAPSLEALWVYVPVMAGAVLMWLPPSNLYLRKRLVHGNGAVL